MSIIDLRVYIIYTVIYALCVWLIMVDPKPWSAMDFCSNVNMIRRLMGCKLGKHQHKEAQLSCSLSCYILTRLMPLVWPHKGTCKRHASSPSALCREATGCSAGNSRQRKTRPDGLSDTWH